MLRMKLLIGMLALVGASSGTTAVLVNGNGDCTRAYGECEVTQFQFKQPNETIKYWECYAQPAFLPSKTSNVYVGGEYCIQP